MHDPAIRTLIVDRYAAVHAAFPTAEYPAYLTVGQPDAPHAVLGFRTAGAEPLLLERYVERSIEHVVSATFGCTVSRDRIAEIGNHASHRPGATIRLWREAAAALEGRADYAVAVLTQPLRAMFARLALPIIVLAPAAISAVGSEAAQWGRYYDADPMLCVGDVALCRRRLDTITYGRTRP
ncbi:thermostable hemolysin [Sphingomonas sp. PAMC 26621]|uniref:thermostable hemolysin n=1 Tax=Sphingomonas sp. PAMC 26621 TaxID=1112213 RepID=UPI000287F7A3|nr:thermostable hemolysin [Sphingomonas sp. PAMC 26621]